MSDLKDELTEIRGVGEATAETILDVVESHTESEDTPELIEEAYDYLRQNKRREARRRLEDYLA